MILVRNSFDSERLAVRPERNSAGERAKSDSYLGECHSGVTSNGPRLSSLALYFLAGSGHIHCNCMDRAQSDLANVLLARRDFDRAFADYSSNTEKSFVMAIVRDQVGILYALHSRPKMSFESCCPIKLLLPACYSYMQ